MTKPHKLIRFLFPLLIVLPISSVDVHYGVDAVVSTEVVPSDYFSPALLSAQLRSLNSRAQPTKVRSYTFSADTNGIDYLINPDKPPVLSFRAWKKLSEQRKPTYPIASYLEICGRAILRVATEEGREDVSTWEVDSLCSLSSSIASHEILHVYFPILSENEKPNRYVSIFLRRDSLSIEKAERIYRDLRQILPDWSIRLWISSSPQFIHVPGFPIRWPFTDSRESGRGESLNERDVLGCLSWDQNGEAPPGQASKASCQVLIADEHE